jgi:hypothetical protein
MSNTESQFSIEIQYELEEILDHKIIYEYNPKTRRNMKIKKYRIKWLGNPETTWEPEENLTKYKEILNKYKNLHEKDGIHNTSYKTKYTTSKYNEYYVTLDEIENQENNRNINRDLNDNESFSLYINKEKKEKKKPVINIRHHKTKKVRKRKEKINNKKKRKNNLDISFSDIIQFENLQSQETIETKKQSKRKAEVFVNITPEANFCPEFLDVLNAYKNRDNNSNQKFINRKRKNNEPSLSPISSSDKIHSPKDMEKIQNGGIEFSSKENISISEEETTNKSEEFNLISNGDNLILSFYERFIKANINKIPKDEILQHYEQLIKKYIYGKNDDFFLD